MITISLRYSGFLRACLICTPLFLFLFSTPLEAAPSHSHVFDIQVATQNSEYWVDEASQRNVIRLNRGQRMVIESSFSPSFQSDGETSDQSGPQGDTSFRILIEDEELNFQPQKTTDSSPSNETSALTISSQQPQTHFELVQGNSRINATTHAGGGKATQYFARGFDLDHGTDLALDIDGIPINMLSHAHGQGYADLSFIIPELVTTSEHLGPYWSEFGNLATAGQLSFNSIESARSDFTSVTTGPNQLNRLLMLKSFSNGALRPIIAAELYTSNGFTDLHEDYQRVNIVADIPVIRTNSLSWKWRVMSHLGKWNAGGQIPERAINNGHISRFGYIDPTDGGGSYRHSISSHLNFYGKNDSETSLLLYGVMYGLNMFSNFSFYQGDSTNGDQIGQFDNRVMLGGKLKTSERVSLLGADTRQTLGVDLRVDTISNQLESTAKRQSIGSIVDAQINESHLGLFTEYDIPVYESLEMTFGLRADVAHYSVRDQLDVLSPTDNSGSGSQFAMMISPKFRAHYAISDALTIYAKAGIGFHSNDARGVTLPSNSAASPLTQARGYEAGLRISPRAENQFELSIWRLDLDNELAWVGDEGVTELKGATRRIGVDFSAHNQLSANLNWHLHGSLSKAEFKDLPAGDNYVPLSPSLVINSQLDMAIGSSTLSVQSRYFGDRAGDESNSVSLGGYLVHHLSLVHSINNDFRIFTRVDNLFDSPFRQAQFYYSSQLSGESNPVDDIHFVPGQPRQISVGIIVNH
jgi:hypothetical protein